VAASIGTDSDLPGMENGGGKPGNRRGSLFPFKPEVKTRDVMVVVMR